MIIKSLSRKSNGQQLINYVTRYILQPEKIFSANEKTNLNAQSQLIIRHNIKSRTVKGIIREYAENEKHRRIKRKDSVRLYHYIVSFSSSDKGEVTPSMLKDIAKKFISLRGLNNLYVAVPHFDRDHIHLHILISGTSLSGKSSRISKQQFSSLKKSLQNYQVEKYPSLQNSRPEHGGVYTRTVHLKNINAKRQIVKAKLLQTLEEVYNGSASVEQFLNQLSDQGHIPYYRAGKLQGIKFEGRIKFRLKRLDFDEQKLNELKYKKVIKKLGNLQADKKLQLAERKSDNKKRVSTMGDKQQSLLEELSTLRDKSKSMDKAMDNECDFERTLFDDL